MRPEALRKAYQRLEKEGDRWAVVLYSALALALRRYHGHAKKRVIDLVDVTWDAWRECAKDHDHSMIQMCEEETGIEIRNGDGSEWRDVWFLNGYMPESMTAEQVLYMRQQQIKWIRPNIMACILIGLHRKHKYGYERCLRLYEEIDDIDREYGADPKKIAKAAMDEVGIDIVEMIHKRRRTEDEKIDSANIDAGNAGTDRREGTGQKLVDGADLRR